MIKRTISYLFIFIVSGFAFTGYAQHDAAYSQYMFSGLLINPAYAGSNGVLNATFSMKNQWTGFNGAPRTAAFALHSSLKNETSGAGVVVLTHRYGLTTRNRISGCYSYKIRLNKNTALRLGLQAGMESQKTDYSKIITTHSGDKSFTQADPRSNYFTSGTGLYLQSNKFFGGISIPVLYHTNSANGIGNKPAFIYSGFQVKCNDIFKIQPSLLYKHLKGSPNQLDVNLLLTYKEIGGAGVSFRTNQTLVFCMYYQLNQQLFIGYSYENNFEKKFSTPGNSHELTVKYLFGYYRNLQNPITFY